MRLLADQWAEKQRVKKGFEHVENVRCLGTCKCASRDIYKYVHIYVYMYQFMHVQYACICNMCITLLTSVLAGRAILGDAYFEKPNEPGAIQNAQDLGSSCLNAWVPFLN